jgi:hypothetical protein
MTWEESARIFLGHVAEANNMVVRMRRSWLRRRRRIKKAEGETAMAAKAESAVRRSS